MSQVSVSDDLTIAIGRSTARLTPSQGLSLAERLARVSFRRACAEEACGTVDLDASDDFARGIDRQQR
jgi:hypothetical protein